MRYDISSLKTVIKDPSYIHSAINYLINYRNTCDFISEDWDNLFLLDACRYDAFSEINDIEGRLSSRLSKGATSLEFIESNFNGRKLHDTVYITANPYVGHIEEDVFHAVVTLFEEWDTNLETVPPDAVVRQVKKLYSQYNDKRIIVHFMQPHQPYIGEKATEIKDKLSQKGKNFMGNPSTTKNKNNTKINKLLSLPDEKRSGGIKMIDAPKYPETGITDEDIWEAYLETLKIALDEIKPLCNYVDGKTVITADHGELIGDKKLLFQQKKYGHPWGYYVEELRKVPWLVIEGNRRNIIEDEPKRYDTVNDIDKKLEALGYK